MVKTYFAVVSALFLLSIGALAAEKTVTLAVENMTCTACPHTVKGSLTAASGVSHVVISFEDKTATVTFDDAKAAIPALVRATTDAGYPSAPRS
jgi:mercuric ion binding protein